MRVQPPPERLARGGSHLVGCGLLGLLRGPLPSLDQDSCESGECEDADGYRQRGLHRVNKAADEYRVVKSRQLVRNCRWQARRDLGSVLTGTDLEPVGSYCGERVHELRPECRWQS